jgi:hypothetical protein
MAGSGMSEIVGGGFARDYAENLWRVFRLKQKITQQDDYSAYPAVTL